MIIWYTCSNHFSYPLADVYSVNFPNNEYREQQQMPGGAEFFRASTAKMPGKVSPRSGGVLQNPLKNQASADKLLQQSVQPDFYNSIPHFIMVCKDFLTDTISILL